MTRTKALVVVGCIMLALAAMAVMELKRESSTTPEGQIVTGAISMTAPSATEPAAPAAPVNPASLPGTSDATPQAPKNGALVSLDDGTLRPDNTAPETVAPTSPVAPATAPPAAPATVAESAKSPQIPAATAEPAKTEPAKEAPATAEPVKAEPAKTAPAKPEKAQEAVKTEPNKAEQVKTEQAEDKSESGKPDLKAIDTAGPAKVEPGQKAIVWTRLELADKSAVFRMSGAEKLEAKAFVLPDPDRYVVDLQGEWAMRLPTVPTNSFIKKIRVGKQGNNTRMVIDLSGTRNCQMVRINPTTLEFRIR